MRAAVEREYPIGVAEASAEVVQSASIGFASYGCATGCNAFDPELREGAGNISGQSRPLRCWRGTEQLDGAGKLGMPAVARRFRSIRTLHEECRREDQMNSEDRGDYQRCELPADTSEMEKRQLHA